MIVPNLTMLNTVMCFIIAMLCIWAELSKHTTTSFWLSLGRGSLAITALVEGSGYFYDQTLALPQALMNGSMALLLSILFFSTQTAVLRKQAELNHQTLRGYILGYVVFWK
jgi:hypothetical protein